MIKDLKRIVKTLKTEAKLLQNVIPPYNRGVIEDCVENLELIIDEIES